MKNRRKAVQPFEIKKRKIDIFRNYEAGAEKTTEIWATFQINFKKIHPFIKTLNEELAPNLKNMDQLMCFFSYDLG